MGITELSMVVLELCKYICEHIQSCSEILRTVLEAIRQDACSTLLRKASRREKSNYVSEVRKTVVMINTFLARIMGITASS